MDAKAAAAARDADKMQSGAGASTSQRSGPLWAHAAVDVAAAAAASAAVAPFIMIIDRAIIEAASGGPKLLSGVLKGCGDALRRPHVALFANPAYYMMVGVYAATYAAANGIDTAATRTDASPATHAAATLAGTTAVNSTACIMKDVAFAKMFGGAAKKAGMPLATVGLFGARDLVTVASAFTVPAHLADALAGGGVDASTADTAARIISPVAMQAICAPCHLLALNLYNAPEATSAARLRAVAALAPATTLAFAARMLPAFSVGGVLNQALLRRGHAAVAAPGDPG
mmetsp:Transcript_27278/g.82251  ORF Transcript_27278/g.82251 Transcript_27278/m.82251 type:complete len:287 (-) Transcript_27278:45-905(-)